MPADALPFRPGEQPAGDPAAAGPPALGRRAAPAAVPGRLTRAFLDLLGRPMTGRVTIYGPGERTVAGAQVPAPPVVVPLVDGILNVSLPPGAYDLYAQLRTVDGDQSVLADVAIIEEPPRA